MENGLYLVEEFKGSVLYRYVDSIIYQGKTKMQKILIAHSPYLGIFLALDNVVQSSEKDYFVYHEALVHPSMISLENPKRALIIGGGEGSTAIELLKYKDIIVDWVEIDGEVIELCKKYLPYAMKNDNKRLNINVQDGFEFIKNTKEKYDIVIGDLTDPAENSEISKRLYSESFARSICNILTDQGIYVVTSWDEVEEGKWLYAVKPRYLQKVFPIVKPIKFYLPSFDSEFLFSVASKKHDPEEVDKEEIKKKIETFAKKLLFYDEEIHYSLFKIPKTVGNYLKFL